MSHTEQTTTALETLCHLRASPLLANHHAGLDAAIAALTAPAAEVPEAMGDEPALPAAAHRGPDGTGNYFDSFTADQMRAYAKQYAQWQSTRLRAAAVPERAALAELFKDAMDWGRSCGQRLNLSDITVSDVSGAYADKTIKTTFTAAPPAPEDGREVVPVEVHDRLHDSAWIAGAKFGWNCGVAGTANDLNAAIEARVRERAALSAAQAKGGAA